MQLIDYPNAESCLMHLVRHGATDHNLHIPPVMQGQGVNGPLAEVGRLQAQRAAAALAARPLAKIYSSPLARALETANAIAAPHGLEPVVAPELIEVDVGDWEGLSWGEIQRDDAKRYAEFMDAEGDHGYPGGERMSEVLGRVEPALAAIMERHVGEEIVVVAHSVVNRLYLAKLLGAPIGHRYRLQQLNCAINTLRCRDGKAKVVTLNASLHLL
ncbi:Phosphoserine phosphatase 1 [Pseudobythopirellula maris]|uniref:Phosphoserine phosphatase 1 n=1 Tax=Pseudobythopirellula maris TaxID=2527991 RepID=A0A5C5ZKN3_9BACT|nr:histidine phosphatase family protein [Pseudobythopirellula maris]TWT87726.1 Phosphoserine phosphatase 1 [Pseudobythopirellula maris]